MKYCVILFFVFLGGCQAFNQANTAATAQAENTLYASEKMAIAQTSVAQRSSVMATAYAAETRVIEVSNVNRQLLATARAGETPVDREIAGSLALGTPEAAGEGRRWFVKTGVAEQVRESDGCVEDTDVVTRFSPTASRIYATFRAFNIGAGTPLAVAWSYNNEVVWEESFNLAESAAQICLWFYIDPTVVEFTPGSWTVALFADGFQLEQPMAFRIEDAMTEGQ
jgi:hypothetical protein